MTSFFARLLLRYDIVQRLTHALGHASSPHIQLSKTDSLIVAAELCEVYGEVSLPDALPVNIATLTETIPPPLQQQVR